jgi:dolichol-phosphate mannosyltransferase
MSNINYENTNIIHTPGKAVSLAEPDQHEQEMPIIHRAPVLPGGVGLFIQRERARLTRLGRFLVVGGTGVLVNSLALLVLFQWAHLALVLASALAAELAIVNNFWWNDRWTFRLPLPADNKRTQLSLHRFARFNLVSLAGLVITTGTLWILVRQLGVYYLAANLLGIALATAWNFAANSVWTWGGTQ